ncbi:hypothetical protein I552_1774 [Mycobacterium xenopi 3993]|nr:hypothetical protein I552_1774 [Mycobacterium xenopi 3993]
MTEPVQHGEQGGIIAEFDRHLMVSANLLSRSWASRCRPLDRPSRPCSRTGRNPFPHFDECSPTRRGFHDQPVHQAARTGQAQP